MWETGRLRLEHGRGSWTVYSANIQELDTAQYGGLKRMLSIAGAVLERSLQRLIMRTTALTTALRMVATSYLSNCQAVNNLDPHHRPFAFLYHKRIADCFGLSLITSSRPLVWQDSYWMAWCMSASKVPLSKDPNFASCCWSLRPCPVCVSLRTCLCTHDNPAEEE